MMLNEADDIMLSCSSDQLAVMRQQLNSRLGDQDVNAALNRI